MGIPPEAWTVMRVEWGASRGGGVRRGRASPRGPEAGRVNRWGPQNVKMSVPRGAGAQGLPGALGWRAEGPGLTGQQVGLAAAVHQEAELQHELRRAAQEGLQQAQHAHVGALEQHPPVEVAPQPLPAPAALQPQVHGAQVPAEGTPPCQVPVPHRARPSYPAPGHSASGK